MREVGVTDSLLLPPIVLGWMAGLLISNIDYIDKIFVQFFPKWLDVKLAYLTFIAFVIIITRFDGEPPWNRCAWSVAVSRFDETSTCEICIDRLARKRNDVCSVARKEMFMRQVILVDNASVMFGLFGKLKDFLIPTLLIAAAQNQPLCVRRMKTK